MKGAYIMLKRGLAVLLVLSLVILGNGMALAGQNGGGSSGSGSTQISDNNNNLTDSINQETNNREEAPQTAMENQIQERNAAAVNSDAQTELRQRTRDRLQTMLKEQDFNSEAWEQTKQELAQLKLQYQNNVEAREEIKNIFQLALQQCRKTQNNQETSLILKDIISMDKENTGAYQELGTILKNQGDNTCHIWCDGSELQPDVPPVIKDNRTLIPARAISEALGAVVQWQQAEQTVLISKGEINIQLRVGNRIALVNGQAVTLDCPAENLNARVFVPLRFVSETMQARVQYFPEGNIVAINE